ncbi:MAG: hypothetical protein U5R30_04405 [Deltaproteobacteria bacterium]|nr:hypothetical protein [Deltaproteobacteria bacterium]
MIYIDPTVWRRGGIFIYSTNLGEEVPKYSKAQSAIEEKAYRDTWGGGLTVQSFCTLFNAWRVIRDLLNEHGALYIHLYLSRGSHDVKLIADQGIGEE